ncbi:MAG: hypothetical protein Q4B42_02300 [Oscillospiraceae bacterium]|nr:hypothetical protein [Oscillospiraceae bacterium]
MFAIKLNPAFKRYAWGGDRLINEFNKGGGRAPLAESWELSCHRDGECLIGICSLSQLEPRWLGAPLKSYLDEHPEYIGEGFASADEFPVIVKFLDAGESLSVQLHPDDAYALASEGQSGKNELLYILDCGEDAELLLGLKEPLRPEDLREFAETGEIVSKLNRLQIESGQSYAIPARTLHAIRTKTLALEIQQSSNVTYRVFDYKRESFGEQKRELHIDKALECADLGACSPKPAGAFVLSRLGAEIRRISDWDCFFAYEVKSERKVGFKCEPDSFHAITMLEGSAVFVHGEQIEELEKGDTIFIPAGLQYYALSGKCSFVLVSCRRPEFDSPGEGEA